MGILSQFLLGFSLEGKRIKTGLSLKRGHALCLVRRGCGLGLWKM